ncbi:MAG TPA: hypothetical protein DCZ95_04060 [Verrucomicrobia bacterium]|nr:MAG: hypothetical protein A2X46_15355 [Lentisphaerae bacterium GWF2_57_35]HBA83250.1 hypothetical protein [Verrucomicrobiota bacterium]
MTNTPSPRRTIAYGLRLTAAAIVMLAAWGGVSWWNARHEPCGAPPPAAEAGSSGKPQVEAASQTPSLLWVADARQMYDYALHTEVALRPLALDAPAASNPVVTRIAVDIEGVLNMRVADTTEVVTVAFQLTPAKVSLNNTEAPELEELFQTPFMVGFSPDGETLFKVFPMKLTQQEKDSLEGLFNLLQISIPTASSRTDSLPWHTIEYDAIGSYVADYLPLDAARIAKAKTAYTAFGAKRPALGDDEAGETAPPPTQPGEDLLKDLMSAKICSSSNVYTLQPGVSWLSACESEERLEVYAQQSLFSESYSTLRMTPRAYRTNPRVDIWSLSGHRDQLMQTLAMWGFYSETRKFDDAWEQAKLQELRKKYANTTVEDLYDDLVDAVNSSSNHVDTIPAIHALRDYLKAYPERAAGVPQLLRNDQLPDEMAGRIIHALELAGTPEAQQALGSIMLNEEQQPSQRLQAVVASGGVEQPSEEMVDDLWALSRSPTLNEPMSNCAVLALGIVSGTLSNTNQTERADAINNEIAALLKSPNPTTRALALTALENAQAAAYEAIAPHLQAADEQERAAAYSALRVCSEPDALTSLRQAFDADASAIVRKAAFDAMASRDPAQASLWARERLGAENNELLRLQLVMALGKQAALPANRATLEAQLARELSPGITNAIHRILSGADLTDGHQ